MLDNEADDDCLMGEPRDAMPSPLSNGSYPDSSGLGSVFDNTPSATEGSSAAAQGDVGRPMNALDKLVAERHAELARQRQDALTRKEQVRLVHPGIHDQSWLYMIQGLCPEPHFV